MKKASVLKIILGLMFFASTAYTMPISVNGDTFTLVATQSGTQLFSLTADDQGRIYAGNNSNNTTGIPVQVFDSNLFSGTPLSFQDIGPAVGDADGITFGNGFIYTSDRDEGIRKISVSNGSQTLHISGVGINATGSPLALRESDNHLFVGLGGLTGINRIDEFDENGSFLQSHTTGTDIETMTFDPTSGLIYYAAFGSTVRALNPITGVDVLVGSVSGTIDGAMTFDPISQQLFIGTANGANSGLVETINVSTGVTSAFASGFNGSTGIVRDSSTGDLYFLESGGLFRLESEEVEVVVPSGVPEANSFLTLFIALALLGKRLKD